MLRTQNKLASAKPAIFTHETANRAGFTKRTRPLSGSRPSAIGRAKPAMAVKNNRPTTSCGEKRTVMTLK